MIKKILFILSINFLCIANSTKFVVITPSYNNESWCIENIKSILNQNYTNFRVIYINDCSTDRTGTLINNYINNHENKNIVKFINNSNRYGALQNIYNAIHSCHDSEVVVMVDGDDWLYDNNVLNYLDSVYQDKNIWLTYGQFIGYPCKSLGWCREFPELVCKDNLFRKYDWISTHLKTFYAGLFKKIKINDLKFQDKFFEVNSDFAFMLPMLEMCTNKHFKYIDRILYVYNVQNPISDFRINSNKQNDCAYYIRNLKPYEPLITL